MKRYFRLRLYTKRITISNYYGHGKLLLTGEYAVLDGAKALSLPTRYGQTLTVKKTRSSDLLWEAKDLNGETWFSSVISLYSFEAVKTTDEKISSHLCKILKNATRLNSEFLNKWAGFKVITTLDFDRSWGLGSSSTLTYLIAEWAEVNAMMLHWKISNGSGYDVATAMTGSPTIFFTTDEETSYTAVDWRPKFDNDLYFVHLGTKQDSSKAVKDYLKRGKARLKAVDVVSALTDEMEQVQDLATFEDICRRHNAAISEATGLTCIADDTFADYALGVIKPLGAWGGDFVLASGSDASAVKAYFKGKGLDTVVSYKDMISA